MSETPKELELQLSVRPSSQPEPETGLQFQLPLPTQDPSEAQQQQTELQPELQRIPLPHQQQSESDPEHQHHHQLGEEAKPVQGRRQRLLTLLFWGFCLCAAVLGLIYYMHHNLQTRIHNQTGPVTPCLSPACKRASAHLSMSADPFTQPCDYFLSSCGPERPSSDSEGRPGGHGIPVHPQNKREKAQWSKMRRQDRKDSGLREGKLMDRKTMLLQYLREILESDDRLTSSVVRKAKGFYHSCLDTRSIETAGAEPFLTLIQKLGLQLGGLAVSRQWNQTDFNSTLSMLMRDYATFPFFNLYVGKDPNDIAHRRNKIYIQIDQPDLLIPIEWNSKTQKSQAKAQTLRPFLSSCQRYLALLGAPSSSSMIHVGMFISLSSELAVAAAPLTHRLEKGQLYQRMTIRELQSQAPAIDWLGCLQAAFHPLPLAEDDHVLLHNLPYIVQMSHIIYKWLNKHELSNSGPLHTYMVLNLLHTLAQALDSRFSETSNNLSVALGDTLGVRPHSHLQHFKETKVGLFESKLYGGALPQTTPRWRRCVLDTERGFDSVLTHVLREQIAHREAEEIIQNILSSLKSKLHQLKWTDQESLQSVTTKVESLIPRLGTTKQIFSEADLDLLFSKVTVSSHDFFSNYIQLLSLWQKRRNKLLTEEYDGADIFSVTPFLLDNQLIFPMGMFVPPLFHPTYPRAMNYGVTGFLIAKDILHLLLPQIHSQSETVYDVAECVWAHYLTVTEKAGRGGTKSLSAVQQQEVWVQYSALQTALQAYHQSLNDCPADTSVSGFSHTRLFLMSFPQINCDSDPHREFMPMEPSFLITAICAKSHLCPASLECPNKTKHHLLQRC
ncbi:kell blood group glycoprotein [Aulostomus maculatus]